MEIGVDAVPAGFFRRAAAWSKSRAALPWPDVAAGIGSGQCLIFPTPSVVTQKKSLPSLMRSCAQDSIKNKGASVFYLKGAIFYLKLSFFVNISAEMHTEFALHQQANLE